MPRNETPVQPVTQPKTTFRALGTQRGADQSWGSWHENDNKTRPDAIRDQLNRESLGLSANKQARLPGSKFGQKPICTITFHDNG